MSRSKTKQVRVSPKVPLNNQESIDVVECFGQDAVNSAFNDTQSKAQDTSIFAAFAQQGQQPIKVSHCIHTKAESR
jgi:hypothetical protein